jgi:hypothetical protein
MSIILVILVVLIVLGLPSWPYSRSWGYGYYPSGLLGIVLLILIILLLMGRL